jgi:hypothetical protein
MMNLAQHPKLRQLARNLQIPESGDSLRELRDHAVARVQRMVDEWSEVETLEDLRMLVSDRLSVKVEFLGDDEDVDRIAKEYRHFLARFRKLLHAEFLTGTTEGLLIDNPDPQSGGRAYLAVIDARGPRAARAYFTAWHELAHLLLCPPQQLLLEGFRRSPIADLKLKDPLESAVDQIAGLLAYWEPLFLPALRKAAGPRLSFEGIERAATSVAPGASLYSASLAAIRLWDQPAMFVTAELGTKTDGTGMALRLQTVIPNEKRNAMDSRIRKKMRVPQESVLSQAFYDPLGTEWGADEDQSDWEVSGQGNLPASSWRVQAVRRGLAVYGLLTPLDMKRAPRRKKA